MRSLAMLHGACFRVRGLVRKEIDGDGSESALFVRLVFDMLPGNAVPNIRQCMPAKAFVPAYWDERKSKLWPIVYSVCG